MKNFIIAIVALIAINGAFWLFNHINAWLGITAFLAVFFAICWHINKEFKKFENDK